MEKQEIVEKVFSLLNKEEIYGWKIEEYEYRRLSGAFMFTHKDSTLVIYATPFWEGASYDFEVVLATGALQMKPLDYDLDVKRFRDPHDVMTIYLTVRNAVRKIAGAI
jgi:hypothetical protein